MNKNFLNYVSLLITKNFDENFLEECWNSKFFDGEIVGEFDWMGTDKIENYNSKNRKKSEYGENDIKYEINEYGYRTSKEINKKILSKKHKNIISCFGCSNTFGIGLPWNDVWTSVLNQNFGDEWLVKNYGVSGAAVDTMSRLIYNYTKIEKPKIICCFFPDIYRMEGYDKGINYFTPHFTEKKDIDKHNAYMEFMCEEYGQYIFIKNFKFIETICKLNNIDFYWFSWSNTILDWSSKKIEKYLNIKNYLEGFKKEDFWEDPKARDGLHIGKNISKRIGDSFYQKILKNYKKKKFNILKWRVE